MSTPHDHFVPFQAPRSPRPFLASWKSSTSPSLPTARSIIIMAPRSQESQRPGSSDLLRQPSPPSTPPARRSLYLHPSPLLPHPRPPLPDKHTTQTCAPPAPHSFRLPTTPASALPRFGQPCGVRPSVPTYQHLPAFRYRPSRPHGELLVRIACHHMLSIMDDLPGTIPKTVKSHPRRPPAHKSVSLRHSPPPTATGTRPKEQTTSRSSPTLASDKANPPSSVSPQLTSLKNSSGESSDAGQWFEKTNNNAKQSKSSFNDSRSCLESSSALDTLLIGAL